MNFIRAAIGFIFFLFLGNRSMAQFPAHLNVDTRANQSLSDSTRQNKHQRINAALDSLNSGDIMDIIDVDTRTLLLFERELKLEKADSLLTIVSGSSHLEISTDFYSRVIYDGRVFSRNAVSLMPGIRYKYRLGFYAELSMYNYFPYDSTFKVPVDQVNLMAGFTHKIIRHWYVDVSYTHWFLEYGKEDVKVADGNGETLQYNSRTLMDNIFDLNTRYNFFNCVDATVDFSFMFGADVNTVLKKRVINTSHETATTLNFDLRKDFPIYIITKKLNSVLSIGPEFLIGCGSENAFKRVNADAINLKEARGSVQQINFWGLLDLEPALNVDWQLRNFDFTFSPRLAVPYNVNPAVHDNKPGNVVPYVTAGIKYMFRIKKGKAKKTNS